MEKTKKHALNAFEKKDFTTASKLYALAYSDDESDLESKAGLMLCSLANEYPDEISALYEFYSITNIIDQDNAYENLEMLIEALEQGSDIEEASTEVFKEKIITEDGITYDDFINIVNQNGDFKTVFEKIFFSTKVVITQKNDFFDFVTRLIDNEYIDVALSYIDSANQVFPSDERLRELLNRISNH